MRDQRIGNKATPTNKHPESTRKIEIIKRTTRDG